MIVTKQHIKYGKNYINPASIKTQQDRKRIIASINRVAKRIANMEAGRIVIDDEHYFIDVKENFIAKLI